MAKTEVRYLIGASICGAVGLIFIIVSYSTQYWVSADLTDGDDSTTSQAHYGLFTGSLDRASLDDVRTYPLYVTCILSDNICAWSCMDTEEARQQEVEDLYEGINVGFACSSASRFRSHNKAAKTIASDSFMEAGLWVSTIFFLSVALSLNALALGFNIFNIIANPIETYSSTKGVTIYYGVSGIATLLTLILWGCQYSIYISNNIAILDTIVGTLRSQAELQWSYYLLIPALIEQLVAMGLIYYRQYVLDRRDADQVIKADDSNNDANTFMY